MPAPILEQDQESVARNVYEGVQEVIRSLNLSRIPPDRVLLRKVAAVKEDDPTPCVVVSFGVEQWNLRGVNELDLNNYNALVTVISSSDRTIEADARAWEACSHRQQIRRAFNGRRMPSDYGIALGGLPHPMTVQPGEQFIDRALRQSMNAQFLVVTVPVDEGRDQ